jgi:hypothetical protein
MFLLTYYMKGWGYEEIMDMATEERKWYMRRLYKQLKAEANVMKGKPGRK